MSRLNNNVTNIYAPTEFAIQDSPLKRQLYEIIEKHPDRVFRGKKV